MVPTYLMINHKTLNIDYHIKYAHPPEFPIWLLNGSSCPNTECPIGAPPNVMDPIGVKSKEAQTLNQILST